MVHHSLSPHPPLLPKTIRPLYWGLHFLWGEGCEGARFCVYILLDLIRKGQSTICCELLFWSKTTPVNHFFYECILWYFAPITCWRTMKMLFTIYCNTSQQQILKFFANRPITFLIWVLFPERFISLNGLKFSTVASLILEFYCSLCKKTWKSFVYIIRLSDIEY